MSDGLDPTAEGGGCVLIVDDDPLLLAILEEQLDSIGLREVRSCERADEALLLLREGLPVATLITDLAMPEMDGPRFLHALAELPGFEARIVLISGARSDILHSSEQLGQALGLRMAGSLAKPVALADLQRLLERREGWGQSRPAPLAVELVESFLLRRALDQREIRPWYQPKLDAKWLRVVGVEALARWTPANARPISPAAFVPVVEAQGWGWDLFLVMLDQVLADQRQWLDRGWRIRAAVNMTMDCTHRLELPDRIAEMAAGHGVPLDLLLLEVTETGLMSDRSSALETLNRLSLMGVGLSIDDFGTGYSSISKLADLPFTELKIDASFVRRLGRDAKAERILHTTIGLGQGLGMTVVAEGVEHFTQLHELCRHEGVMVQGFLLARPMPAAALADWVVHWRPGLQETVDGRRIGLQRPLGALIYAGRAEQLPSISACLRALRPGWLTAVATDLKQAAETLRGQAVDLLLVDGPHCLEPDLARLRDLAPAAALLVFGQPPSPCERALAQQQALLAPEGLSEAALREALQLLDGPPEDLAP